jgi:hypothetical protein
MSEKVLFEFRTEENEDGYIFEVKHDKEAFPCWSPSLRKGFFPRVRREMRRRLRKHRRSAKRRMRRNLDFYERVYEELYGPVEEGEE